MRLVIVVVSAALVTGQGVVRAQARLGVRLYSSGFSSPVAIVQDPTNRFVQLVVEQGGRVRVVRAGARLAADFLDLRAAISCCGERGLLGLAFAPDYADSGRFFLNFTDTSGNTVVARFRRSSDPLLADPASRFDLRVGGSATIAQPYSNHNGGHLAFGPDGYLYVGLGDGGSANDPQNRAQDRRQLLGKMLRLDVSVPDSDGAGYRVPPDNPFVGGPAGTPPEIWSFGLRNPWRYTFDDPALGGTGALTIADVGQSAWEEINYEPPRRGGRNYGWRVREGAHNNITSPPPAYTPLTDPIFEYPRATGQSVTGGYVYRGRSLGAGYQGRYFFADFVRGRVWSLGLALDGQGEASAAGLVEHTGDLGGSQLGMISSFGVDADGELFIVSHSTGQIFQVLGPPMSPPAPTGLRIIR